MMRALESVVRADGRQEPSAGEPAPQARRPSPRSERTRARLLSAAEQVFGERGYEQASIAEMTGRAGIALGTFYVHFSSKKALFDELLSSRTEELRLSLRRAVEGAGTVREMEEARSHAFFDWVARRAPAFRVARQCEYVDPALAARWKQAFAGDYAATLARAMDAGEIPPADPELLAASVLGMTEALATRALDSSGGLEARADLATAAAAITTRALGCPAPSDDGAGAPARA